MKSSVGINLDLYSGLPSRLFAMAAKKAVREGLVMLQDKIPLGKAWIETNKTIVIWFDKDSYLIFVLCILLCFLGHDTLCTAK